MEMYSSGFHPSPSLSIVRSNANFLIMLTSNDDFLNKYLHILCPEVETKSFTIEMQKMLSRVFVEFNSGFVFPSSVD